MLRSKAVLDTNLLLLKIVGELRPDLIGKHRRLRTFGSRDHELLEEILSGFSEIVTTPNVLTEASNFIGRVGSEICSGANTLLSAFVATTEETVVPSQRVVEMSVFNRLGLTDTVLIKLAADGVTTVTDDFPLANRLHKLDLPCINFYTRRTPQRYQ